jgi:hypothetical protein
LNIRFSAPAEQRLIERRITKKQVIEALTPPTNITPGKDGRLVATKNQIRVVHVKLNNQIVVVTVTRE